MARSREVSGLSSRRTCCRCPTQRRSRARSSSRLRLRELGVAGHLGEFVFGEEGDLAALDAENALLEVDAGLVRLEHVEPEEKIDGTSLHDGEGAREVEVCELELGAVHASEDLRCPDALCDSGEAAVDESCETTAGV